MKVLKVCRTARSRTMFGLAVLVGAVTLLRPAPADACRCMPPKPANERLDAYDAILEGKVSGVTPSSKRLMMSKTYTFKVLRYWKGDLKNMVKVSANTSSAACGTSFTRGETYLVFAGKSSDGKYSTSSCAFNKIASAAADDIKLLGEGTVPKAKGDACPPGQTNVIRCIKAPCPVKCEPIKHQDQR